MYDLPINRKALLTKYIGTRYVRASASPACPASARMKFRGDAAARTYIGIPVAKPSEKYEKRGNKALGEERERRSLDNNKKEGDLLRAGEYGRKAKIY